jgi:hypothetical protein
MHAVEEDAPAASHWKRHRRAGMHCGMWYYSTLHVRPLTNVHQVPTQMSGNKHNQPKASTISSQLTGNQKEQGQCLDKSQMAMYKNHKKIPSCLYWSLKRLF